ncbi:MAG: hypothetical protein AAF447_01085 [Myxococcota bacterium]
MLRFDFPGALALLLAASLAGCAGAIRRFPDQEPDWVDEGDFRPFSPQPEEYYSGLLWDGADQMVFRPLSQAFRADIAEEALGVNAFDEAPASAWYTPRLSVRDLTTAEIVRGPCYDAPPLRPPFIVVDVKPNGATPGFFVKDADGRKYLMKFDRERQPERSSTGDVVSSRIYWATGFSTPCNRVVNVTLESFEIDPEGTVEIDGEDVPLTWELFAGSLEAAGTRADGSYRGLTSLFLPGRPIGPFRYEGRRRDDPNDAIPHQERRDLRGTRVIAAWTHHFDTREQNSLNMWMPVGDEGLGYVRHNYVDFGDTFGSLWARDGISRRLGPSGYFNLYHVAGDFVTLGLMPRAYYRSQLGPTGPVWGYFDVETFEPDDWKAGYPNPAHLRATERDKAWMARQVALFDPDTDLPALVEAAQMDNDFAAQDLVRILRGRRMKILERYLTRVSPLTWPTLRDGPEGPELCLKDLAVTAELIAGEDRPYWSRAWELRGARRLRSRPTGRMTRVLPDRVCVGLPEAPDATPEEPAYLIVDVAGLFSPDDRQARPLRVHLITPGGGRARVVGLERPYDLDEPDRWD